MSDRYDRGMEVRRAVLGDAYVRRARASTSSESAAFQELITEEAWGTVWASDAISRRERSMLTLALLAGLGNFEELRLHLHAARRTGCSKTDVMEVFQHVAIYAGVPRANHAIKIAQEIWATHQENDR
ncbi:MAG: 4-carboxymuconolactone decarboxylase [Pseudomonadota bacterium]